jgi:DHA2 family multidrug resistance protein-like MFS transporter
VGSQAAPRIVQRVKPGYLISGGLAFGSLGLFLLTQVGTANGLPLLVVASVVISLGLAPVFGLTTELIVGSAPPERSGAASGISETGAELGGALGLALLGSIGVAIYRGGLAPGLLASLPSQAATAARDTLGGAVAVASELPAATADLLLTEARTAFVNGMHVAALIAGVIGLGLAAFAFVTLRGREMEGSEDEPTCVEPTMIDEPVLVPLAKPARECF